MAFDAFTTILPVEHYASIGLITLIVGFLTFLYFFMYFVPPRRYELTRKINERSLKLEILLTIVAGTTLSSGLFLLSLAFGLDY